MARERITGWHFDKQDTPQQRYVLRTNRAAQKVRLRFPTGTRVRALVGSQMTLSTVGGVVVRHVPGSDAQGGVVVVHWDNRPEGQNGRHCAIALTREEA